MTRVPAEPLPPAEPGARPQAVVLGLLGEYVGAGERLWSGGLVELLVQLGFTPASSRVAMQRLARQGLLVSTKSGRTVHYEVGPALWPVFDEGRRRIFSLAPQETWDGTWTVMWHAVPDERLAARRQLGRRLAFLGFAPMRDGTWISPHDRRAELASVLAALRLDDHATVMHGAVREQDTSAMIARGWDLDGVEAGYTSFVTAFRTDRSTPTPAEAFVLRTRAIEAVRAIVPLDPRLPDAVLRRRWRRAEAIAQFRAVTQSQQVPAAAHVRATLQLTDPRLDAAHASRTPPAPPPPGRRAR